METFDEIINIIHSYINNFDYKNYFYNSMIKLINNTIENFNINECFILFSSNYYNFNNLECFYDYSINNKRYLNNCKKLNDTDKTHLMEKGIKVLYQTYSKEIIELINLYLINVLFENIPLIHKYNYNFNSFKENSSILYTYLKKVYNVDLKKKNIKKK